MEKRETGTDQLPDFKKLFNYDANNGQLVWKINSGRANIGNVAGTLVSGGYIRVLIRNKSYAVHHIIWWLETGRWPKEIDHIDRNPCNNVFSNLREVSRSENMLNKPLQSNNTSGVKGVHYCSWRGKWKVQCRKVGKTPIQEYYDSKEDAIRRRLSIESEYYGETYLRNKYASN